MENQKTLVAAEHSTPSNLRAPVSHLPVRSDEMFLGVGEKEMLRESPEIPVQGRNLHVCWPVLLLSSGSGDLRDPPPNSLRFTPSSHIQLLLFHNPRRQMASHPGLRTGL